MQSGTAHVRAAVPAEAAAVGRRPGHRRPVSGDTRHMRERRWAAAPRARAQSVPCELCASVQFLSIFVLRRRREEVAPPLNRAFPKGQGARAHGRGRLRRAAAPRWGRLCRRRSGFGGFGGFGGPPKGRATPPPPPPPPPRFPPFRLFRLPTELLRPVGCDARCGGGGGGARLGGCGGAFSLLYKYLLLSTGVGSTDEDRRV
eukprot:SAG31_NODE_2131_length_6375_cov_5.937540_3_plen_202_part_00